MRLGSARIMTRTRLLGLAFTLACGCANATAPGSHDDGGSGADSGSGAGTDATPIQPESGHQSHGFVAGGVVAKSASFKLIGTLTSGKGTAKSATYIEHGGVLGSTQK